MMKTVSKNHIHVTCAIIEQHGLVLAAQRSAIMKMPLKWEFPGGKIDPGESPAVCLHRELFEELGLRVQIRESLQAVTHPYPSFIVTLYPFICTPEPGGLTLNEHQATVWLRPEALPSLDWAEADIPVVSAYLARMKRKSP